MKSVLLSSLKVNLQHQSFLDYFVSTYFEGKFPLQLWNHFDTIGEPRTNNHLEGFNLKLKKAVIVAHPDIFKAISSLQDQECEACLNYYKALNGERIPARKKKEIKKDG